MTRDEKTAYKYALQSEGRWDAFVAFREQLVEGGMARAEAWKEAVQEFQPAERAPSDGGQETARAAAGVKGGGSSGENQGSLPRPQVGLGGLPQAVLEDFEGKSRSTLRKDIEWVYQHFAMTGLEPEDAPSPGAWGLLVWVRESKSNRSEFFKSLVAKLIPSRQAFDRDERELDESRDLLGTIGRLRRAHDDAALPSGAPGVQGEPEVP